MKIVCYLIASLRQAKKSSQYVNFIWTQIKIPLQLDSKRQKVSDISKHDLSVKIAYLASKIRSKGERKLYLSGKHQVSQIKTKNMENFNKFDEENRTQLTPILCTTL